MPVCGFVAIYEDSCREVTAIPTAIVDIVMAIG